MQHTQIYDYVNFVGAETGGSADGVVACELGVRRMNVPILFQPFATMTSI